MFACRWRIAAATAIGLALLAAPPPACAQNTVLVVVNGDPITSLDIEHRTRFHQIANPGKKLPTRQEVLSELIDEKLKLQLPRRYDFSNHNVDNDVDSALTSMARRQLKPLQQFTQELKGLGVLETLKSRVKADIIWTQIIRGKFQSTLQMSDNEILKEVESRNKEDKEGYDYTLRPILFIVPRGAPQVTFETRRREADGLRQRFQNCNEGLAFARALHDIAVREPIVRSSADLAPALREILDKTEVGKLTSPETTTQGIEVYALCAKKPSSKENTLGKREVREEIYAKNFQASAKKYLKELRDQAYCTAPDGHLVKGCSATSILPR